MRPDLDPYTRKRFRIQASSIIRMPARSFADDPASHRKAFVIGAGDCLDAAERMSREFGDRTPEKILTFHALELGLKAFLVSQGYRPATLAKRPFGHDLDQLFLEAKSLGLQLQYAEADYIIEWINEWHDGGAKIRYDFISQRDLPMGSTIFPLAAEIIRSARDATPATGFSK